MLLPFPFWLKIAYRLSWYYHLSVMTQLTFLPDEKQLIQTTGTDAISSVFTHLVTANQLTTSQTEDLCRKLCDVYTPLCAQIAVTDCNIDQKISRLRSTISKIGVTVCIEMSKKQPVVDQQLRDCNPMIVTRRKHDPEIYIQVPSYYHRSRQVQQVADSGPVRITRYSSVAAVYKQQLIDNKQTKNEQPKKEQPKNEQPKKEQPKKEQPKKEQPKKEQPKRVSFSVEIARIRTYNVIDDDSTDDDLPTMFQSTEIHRY